MVVVNNNEVERALSQRGQKQTAGSFAFHHPIALPDIPVVTANKDSRSSAFQPFTGQDVIIQRTNEGGEERVHVTLGTETKLITGEGACLEVGLHFINAWLAQG